MRIMVTDDETGETVAWIDPDNGMAEGETPEFDRKISEFVGEKY